MESGAGKDAGDHQIELLACPPRHCWGRCGTSATWLMTTFTGRCPRQPDRCPAESGKPVHRQHTGDTEDAHPVPTGPKQTLLLGLGGRPGRGQQLVIASRHSTVVLGARSRTRISARYDGLAAFSGGFKQPRRKHDELVRRGTGVWRNLRHAGPTARDAGLFDRHRGPAAMPSALRRFSASMALSVRTWETVFAGGGGCSLPNCRNVPDQEARRRYRDCSSSTTCRRRMRSVWPCRGPE